MGIIALDGKKVGRFTLRVDSRRKLKSELYFFSIFLEKRSGARSVSPICGGVYSAGIPYEKIKPWIDCDYLERVKFPDKSAADLARARLSKKFFSMLGAVIPAGGSLMVGYGEFFGETRLHKSTARMLNRGVSPKRTPIGKLLIAAGCASGMRDWYFPEGGREGHMKLQGFKPDKPSRRKN